MAKNGYVKVVSEISKAVGTGKTNKAAEYLENVKNDRI